MEHNREHGDSGNLLGHSRLSTGELGPGTCHPCSWLRARGSVHPAWLLGDQHLEDQMAPGTVASQGRSQTTCFHGQHGGVSLAGGSGGF